MLDELGRGGMGVVYRCDNSVWAATWHSRCCSGPSTKEEEQEYRRFKQEAILLATLGHANIVKVFDIGEADGRPYFVMELVDGASLAARLGGNPRPPKYAAETIKTLSAAVEICAASKRSFTVI